MTHVKIIQSAEEHEQAFARVLQLMDLRPVPGSPEDDELELLTLIIQRYEQKHFPIDPVGPVDVIKFMMEQQGLKKKDLIPYIGSAPKVTEVLNGKRTLSLGMIRRLSVGLGIPVSMLIKESSRKSA